FSLLHGSSARMRASGLLYRSPSTSACRWKAHQAAERLGVLMTRSWPHRQSGEVDIAWQAHGQIPDALCGYSQLKTLSAAAACCQMHLEIFLAVIVGELFARLDSAEREDIYATPADIDLTIRRAGVVDEAGG